MSSKWAAVFNCFGSSSSAWIVDILNHTVFMKDTPYVEMEEVEILYSSRTSCKGLVMYRCGRCGE